MQHFLASRQGRLQAARQEGNVVVVEGEAAGLLAPTHSERASAFKYMYIHIYIYNNIYYLYMY